PQPRNYSLFPMIRRLVITEPFLPIPFVPSKKKTLHVAEKTLKAPLKFLISLLKKMTIVRIRRWFCGQDYWIYFSEILTGILISGNGPPLTQAQENYITRFQRTGTRPIFFQMG